MLKREGEHSLNVSRSMTSPDQAPSRAALGRIREILDITISDQQAHRPGDLDPNLLYPDEPSDDDIDSDAEPVERNVLCMDKSVHGPRLKGPPECKHSNFK